MEAQKIWILFVRDQEGLTPQAGPGSRCPHRARCFLRSSGAGWAAQAHPWSAVREMVLGCGCMARKEMPLSVACCIQADVLKKGSHDSRSQSGSMPAFGCSNLHPCRRDPSLEPEGSALSVFTTVYRGAQASLVAQLLKNLPTTQENWV